MNTAGMDTGILRAYRYITYDTLEYHYNILAYLFENENITSDSPEFNPIGDSVPINPPWLRSCY